MATAAVGWRGRALVRDSRWVLAVSAGSHGLRLTVTVSRPSAKQIAALSVPFEANQGQFAPEVAFAARTFAGALFVTNDGRIVHALPGKLEQKKETKSNEKATAGKRCS